MSIEVIKSAELKGLLYGEFANEVEELTKEQVVGIIDRVKDLWFDLWEDTEKKTERDLWNTYHEEYHSNEGNVLFECIQKTPDEVGIHVLFTTCRLLAVVIDEKISFRLAVTYHGEMQDEEGNHIELVDTGTHEEFEQRELGKMIERFLQEVKNK